MTKNINYSKRKEGNSRTRHLICCLFYGCLQFHKPFVFVFCVATYSTYCYCSRSSISSTSGMLEAICRKCNYLPFPIIFWFIMEQNLHLLCVIEMMILSILKHCVPIKKHNCLETTSHDPNG